MPISTASNNQPGKKEDVMMKIRYKYKDKYLLLSDVIVLGLLVSAWLLTDLPPAPLAEAASQSEPVAMPPDQNKKLLEESVQILDALIRDVEKAEAVNAAIAEEKRLAELQQKKEQEQQERLAAFKQECDKQRQERDRSQQLAQAKTKETPKAAPAPPVGTKDPFLKAESVYRVPWQITYAMYALETDLGQNQGICPPKEVMSGQQWSAFEKICRQIGVDPYRQRVSKTGDMGPMQFQPETWECFGTDADGDGLANPWSLADAACSAARYLEQNGYHSSPANSVAAYNGGAMRDPQIAARATAYSRKVCRQAQLLGWSKPNRKG